MTLVKDIYNYINSIAPYNEMEEWDNSGFILGDDEKKEEVMQVLNRASGFVRSLIAKRINLRVTPEIKFILDDSLEYSFKIDKIIREINDK